MDYSKYIGKEVLIRSNEDYDDGMIHGYLDRIIPAVEAETFFDTLVVITNDTEKLFPINDIIQFFLKESFENEDTLYFYVIFRCGKTERSKEHRYMSYDYSIKPGDKVIVWEDFLYVGNVIRTGFYKKSDAPYPVEKTWLIEKKVYDRVDYMQYDDANLYIKHDNLYMDNYLNSENNHRQFIASAKYCYKDLSDSNDEYIKKNLSYNTKTYSDESTRIKDYKNSIIGDTEYNLDWEWCESNQTDVFYRTLWLCRCLSEYCCYDKFYFDKFLCLSLIYKHGDFDKYLVCPEIEIPLIDKDIRIVESFIQFIV